MTKQFSNRDINRLLKRHEKLDYIAYVITPWHALALEAAVKEIESSINKSMKGLIVIKPHVDAGILLDDTRFSHLSAEVYYYYDDDNVIDKIIEEVHGIFYYLKLKNEHKEIFYAFIPNGFRYPILSLINRGIGKEYMISVVSIDEGLGAYLYSQDDWFRVCLSEQKSFNGKIKAYIKNLELRIMSQDKIKKTGHFINCDLLKKENQTKNYIVNGNMAEFFAKSITEHSIRLGLDASKMPSRYILINTQPFDNYSVTEVDSKNIVLERCVKTIQETGYDVIIKPHPRENDYKIYEKMGAKVWNLNQISQEALLSLVDNKPTYVVGYYSTTLVTSNLFFGIPTISLGQILCKEGNLTEEYRAIFSNFYSKFNNFVYFVNNYNELIDLFRIPIEKDE